jgi:uncharacterized tellurite resistance protein B-like protein
MIDPKVLKLRDRLIQRGAPAVSGPAASPSNCTALLERVRPFAQVMLIVMTAASEIDDSARSAIRGALRFLTDFRLDDAAIERLLEQSEAGLAARGGERYLEYAADHLSANRDDSELALALSAAVAAADDQLRTAESQVLRRLRELLGISEKRFSELLGSLSD